MPDYPAYTADQVALAARELREAAGAPQQSFTSAQVVSMLADKVRRASELLTVETAIQDKALGLGHAVGCAEGNLTDDDDAVISRRHG